MKPKVIVVGLDGLEPAIVERMLERNQLPNLAKLRQAGTYTRLRTTYPAETPVAWSSFATGTNPGGHGIFDFICRDPETYLPDIALSRFERPKSMLALPKVVNRRRGVPVWQHLSKAGVPSVILRCPCTFPAESLTGKMLAGVGVPDLRGSQGTGTFYTQDRSVQPKEHEQVVYLDSAPEFVTRAIGPRNTRSNPPSDAVAEIRVKVDRERRKLVITAANGACAEVPEKGWSGWIRLKFKLSMLQSLTGIMRFYCRQLEPHLEFYASPVNFDPAAPPFPVTYPAEYGKALSESIGLFSTVGMAEDHTGHNNGRFDEQAYAAQCDLVMQERERMMLHELERFREGLFFVLFDTPDRLQHMFWRFLDPSHPNFDADRAAELGQKVTELYQRCDSVLARVLDKIDENTVLMVLSDHGFNSFRRAFHTNTWLWQNNLLALKDGKKPEEGLGEGFSAVDWGKTYAYSLGLAGIYLNLKGREAGGILEEASSEAERVRRAIQDGLAGFPDADGGKPAIRSVSRREEIYSGAYAGEAPDLLVNFHPGYRVSWQTSLGGFSHSLFEDNTRRWSGDHIIDPEAVPGILFMNRPLVHNHAAIVDLAPTILQHLGVAGQESMEGKSLL
ncbi:MAG TPA: alkaline phosphatase family protein [Terriglobales bacterium]|nr:alkaline phosphatase family protein [Terriglobales bacterium]